MISKSIKTGNGRRITLYARDMSFCIQICSFRVRIELRDEGGGAAPNTLAMMPIKSHRLKCSSPRFLEQYIIAKPCSKPNPGMIARSSSGTPPEVFMGAHDVVFVTLHASPQEKRVAASVTKRTNRKIRILRGDEQLIKRKPATKQGGVFSSWKEVDGNNGGQGVTVGLQGGEGGRELVPLAQ